MHALIYMRMSCHLLARFLHSLPPAFHSLLVFVLVRPPHSLRLPLLTRSTFASSPAPPHISFVGLRPSRYVLPTRFPTRFLLASHSLLLTRHSSLAPPGQRPVRGGAAAKGGGELGDDHHVEERGERKGDLRQRR